MSFYLWDGDICSMGSESLKSKDGLNQFGFKAFNFYSKASG